MNIRSCLIHAGIGRKVRLLHVSDTHLSLTDLRDDARKHELAVRRNGRFGGLQEKYLEEQSAYAREKGELLIHSGDLIDFVSRANLDKARAFLDSTDTFFIAGNHEFSQYHGEACEDTAYKINSYFQIRERLGRDLFFASREYCGINIVGIDDTYYRFEDWQTERLAIEAEKGLPILLVIHNPLYEESLFRHSMDELGQPDAGLVGCGERQLMRFNEYRAFQQRPDAATMRFIDHVYREKSVFAILSGHLHYPFASMLLCGKMQYVAGAGFEGDITEYTIE